MKPGVIEDFATRIESEEKLFIGEVFGMSKILFSKYAELFNIYKMVHLVPLDSKQKTVRNH